jgi:hypothetical protein
MRIHALLALIITGCALTLFGGQSSPSVCVIDSSSGRPIPGAAVLLSREDGTVLETETGSEGQAAFPGLRPGAYWIRAEKPGYVDLLDPHGRGRPAVLSSANKNPIAIGLTRSVAISGQVLDSQGRPLQLAKVIAVVRRSVHGEARLTPFGEAARTDDGGRYRLHGLPPGYYSVSVVPTGDAPGAEVFAPICFPGTADPGKAEFFELKSGESKTSVDLTVAVSEALSISGTVSGIPEDEKPNRAAVSLAKRGGLRVPIASVLTASGGAFVIPNVPPGEYQLTAWTPTAGRGSGGPPAGVNARSAVRSVSVPGGDLQVDLELRPLVRTSGRLAWDGSPAGDYACGGTGQIAFHSEDGWLDVWPPVVGMNGDRFTVEGLPAGRYWIEMPGLGALCRLAAVRVGNQEATGGVALIDGPAPLTIVLSTATGEVSGAVTAEDAKPAVGVVLLLSTDGHGAVQAAQVDAEGHYSFSEVLAGVYRLIALDRLNSTDYLDPFEAPKLGAKLVVIKAGRTATSDLRLVRQ